MKVTWKSGVAASRIGALTVVVLSLTGMVSGATASFANPEQMTGVAETRTIGSDSRLVMAEDQSSSPQRLATPPARGIDAARTTGVPTSVNALEGSTSNDGFMLILSLLLIAVGSTAITWGLARWIDPKKSDQMDKVHVE